MTAPNASREGNSNNPGGKTSRICALFEAILTIALFLFSPTALAQNLSKVVWFNIKSQTLATALLEFGRQAHVQIMFASKITAGHMRTQEVNGGYTGGQALALLLQRTGLTYVERRNSIEVMRIGSGTIDSPKTHKTIKHQNSTDAQDSNDPPLPSPRKKASHKKALQEVVITGSRLPTTSEYGPQEVQIYSQYQIQQSGQTSVSDFLSTLPSVSVTSPATINYAFSTTVQLRGLPAGTTLVLLNGRTLEGSGTASGGSYFDLSYLPLAAVQRIEIDETGASAVYGSDAIAGVVNIVLKKDLNGFAANARYGWAKDVPSWNADFAFGRQWDRGGFSLIGSYETEGELLNSERLLSASNDYQSYGGPNENLPVCFGADVFSTSGAPLPGAPAGSNATYAAVTGSTSSGKPPLSQFTYGALNECSELAGHALLPAIQRESVFTQGHLNITSAITAFTELMYTHLTRTMPDGYASLFGTLGFQQYTVSAGNPFNPFGTAVGVTELLRSVPEPENISTDFFRPLVGLKGTLPHQWMWELSAWQSTDWTGNDIENYFPDQTATQDELNSSNPTTALNPFVTGPIGPPELIESLFTALKTNTMGSDRSVEAWIRGPVIRLPAGKVRLVIGGDHVGSTFHENTSGGTGVYTSFNKISTYHRNYSALFGEIQIPLIKRNSSQSRSLVALTGSGRYDRYSDFGADATEQLGLEIRPTQALLVRGTYGTSFAAPSLIDLFGPQTENPGGLVQNPSTGVPERVQLTSGGNPSLRPLTGRSHTVGVVYSSRSIRGLLLSATQWNVAENNYITEFPAQEIVDNPTAFPGRVIFDSSGNITAVNATYANFGSINVAGIDYRADYAHDVGQGVGSIDLEATQMYHYLQSLVPGAQPIESVSNAQDNGAWAPKWKGTVGLGWAYSSVQAHLDGRYTGAYQDYDSRQTIGNFWMVDASVRWSIGQVIGEYRRYLSDAYVEAGGTNIFNRGPQFSNYEFDALGYDGAQMSVIGRALYMRVGMRW